MSHPARKCREAQRSVETEFLANNERAFDGTFCFRYKNGKLFRGERRERSEAGVIMNEQRKLEFQNLYKLTAK